MAPSECGKGAILMVADLRCHTIRVHDSRPDAQDGDIVSGMKDFKARLCLLWSGEWEVLPKRSCPVQDETSSWVVVCIWADQFGLSLPMEVAPSEIAFFRKKLALSIISSQSIGNFMLVPRQLPSRSMMNFQTHPTTCNEHDNNGSSV